MKLTDILGVADLLVEGAIKGNDEQKNVPSLISRLEGDPAAETKTRQRRARELDNAFDERVSGIKRNHIKNVLFFSFQGNSSSEIIMIMKS